MKRMLWVTVIIFCFSWLIGCATAPRKSMIWVPVTTPSADTFKQDNYLCQQEAGAFSGAYSQTGTISNQITRKSTYQTRYHDCLEARGYSLEDKEMYDNKVSSLKKISNECPARLGIILSYADIAQPQIVGIDKDGPAAKAGLEKGDIVKKINDVEISSSVQLMRHLSITIKPGVPVEISIIRKEVFPKTFTVIPEKK